MIRARHDLPLINRKDGLTISKALYPRQESRCALIPGIKVSGTRGEWT